MYTSPFDGLSMVPMIFSNVVLPPPDVPNIVINSPSLMVKLTPLRAGTPSNPKRYVLCTLTSLITSLASSLISSSLSYSSSSKSYSPSISAMFYNLEDPTYRANESGTPSGVAFDSSIYKRYY